MSNITSAQIRKIHVLSRERGIDNDTLHAYVHTITKKNSLKYLTIIEAIKVIDGLQGTHKAVNNMMTDKQKNFIIGLVKDIGWVNEEGTHDERRLIGFIRERFRIERIEWVTSKRASEIIEALKAIKSRMETELHAI